MIELSNNTLFRRRTDLAFIQLGCDAVAIDVKSNECYSLNTTAKRIWDSLENFQTPSDLCANLVTIYRVDPVTCQKEVLQLLRDLHRAGLVEIADA